MYMKRIFEVSCRGEKRPIGRGNRLAHWDDDWATAGSTPAGKKFALIFSPGSPGCCEALLARNRSIRDAALHGFEAIGRRGVEADARIGCELAHEIDDLLEQRHALAGLPQPGANQDAIKPFGF
jgi:hypothetical protein